jgi:hypothetical protein
MTAYAVYTTEVSAAIIVAFGVLAFSASAVQVFIDIRYPPTREDRHRQTPDAIELTDLEA